LQQLKVHHSFVVTIVVKTNFGRKKNIKIHVLTSVKNKQHKNSCFYNSVKTLKRRTKTWPTSVVSFAV